MDDAILKTERLILRYQRKSDIKFLVGLWMDEDITKYAGGPREKSRLIEEYRNVAEEPQKAEYDLWCIELKHTRELIGQAGLIPRTIKGKELIEFGCYIDKAKWGKGYAKEIAASLLEYAFREKKLDKVIATIDPENEPPKAVAKSIGMKYWMNDESSGKVKSIYIKRKEEA
jgi:ribosomal-protein-alanine N-acetyltransferase